VLITLSRSLWDARRGTEDSPEHARHAIANNMTGTIDLTQFLTGS